MSRKTGKDAKIKRQERQIRSLEYAVKAMQERADAVLYYLQDTGLIDREYSTIASLLEPMRTSKNHPRSPFSMGRYFPGDLSRKIDNQIETEELKRINKLYEYLQGKLPKGVTCFAPKLSKKKAFSVIWFLQEVIECLPQKYECCSICGDIYNSEAEGHYTELNGGEHYCGGCCDGLAPVTCCWDCGTDVLRDEAWRKEYSAYLCDECKKERDEKENNKEE